MEVQVGIKDRKNWNWKQITTATASDNTVVGLVSKIERTEIESKSQPTTLNVPELPGWYQR